MYFPLDWKHVFIDHDCLPGFWLPWRVPPHYVVNFRISASNMSLVRKVSETEGTLFIKVTVHPR